MLTRRVFLLTCFFGLIAACQQQGTVPAAHDTGRRARPGETGTDCGSIQQPRRDTS